MPSKSLKQHNLFKKVAASKDFADKVGIKQSVAREFLRADKKAGKYQYPVESSEHKGWYVVEGYPYFLVNKDGKVKNAKTGYETFGSLDDKGYRRVCQWDNKSQTKKEYKAHHIVCTAFHGPCPGQEYEVGHKDDDRANNRPTNLHWTTRKDNMTKANQRRASLEGYVGGRRPLATLITGNPRFIDGNDEAEKYYQDIEKYLVDWGYEVARDPGENFTCPPKSDLYVGHSRGAGRYRCVANNPDLQWRFLKFGDLDGYIHPKDAQFQKANQHLFGTSRAPTPPKEHYEFTKEQKRAIDTVSEKVFANKRRPSTESAALENAYVARVPNDASLKILQDLQRRLGLENPIPAKDLHITLLYSPEHPLEDYTAPRDALVSYGGWKLLSLDEGRVVAIELLHDQPLKARHAELLEMGGVHTYPSLLAHISLSYNDQVHPDVADRIDWDVKRKLTFIKEYLEPIEETPEEAMESALPKEAPASLSW